MGMSPRWIAMRGYVRVAEETTLSATQATHLLMSEGTIGPMDLNRSGLYRAEPVERATPGAPPNTPVSERRAPRHHSTIEESGDDSILSGNAEARPLQTPDRSTFAPRIRSTGQKVLSLILF